MVLTDEGLVGQCRRSGLIGRALLQLSTHHLLLGQKVVRTGDVALVSATMPMKSKGLCKMTNVNQDMQVVVGDILETSGLSSVYAPGVAIGRVKEIVTDSTGGQFALIEPLVDFKSTRHVL